MNHVGVICPNTPGHVNAMLALADATRARGHRVTFFLLGKPPASIATTGFETVSLGGTVFPADARTRPSFRSSARYKTGRRSSTRLRSEHVPLMPF